MSRRDRWIRKSAISVTAAVLGLPVAVMADAYIDLDASSSSTLQVSSNSSPCPGEGLACINVPGGSSHNLFFDLKKACKQDGPQYRLSSFRIAMQNKNWPTQSNPLPANIAGDFNADPNSGYVMWDGNNSLSEDKIKIRDKNVGAYSVFYEITATGCNGAGEIKLDPVIRNGGGGNP